ncbi:hypothetical protein ACHAPU_003094 [Fusarium lateritium]
MKDRTSDHIHFPRHAERLPRRANGACGYSDLLGRAVLISIINYLADVVDAVEDIKLPKQHKDRTKLKNDKKKLCTDIVRAANTFTTLFNSAKSQTKYTDPAPKNLPLFRDEIQGQLLSPLSRAKTTKPTLSRTFSFSPYQQRLSVILSGIEEEICWWLRVPRPTKTSSSPHHLKQSVHFKHPTKACDERSTRTGTTKTSKSHGTHSTRTAKPHDSRSSRADQPRSQRPKRSSSPSPASSICTVM